MTVNSYLSDHLSSYGENESRDEQVCEEHACGSHFGFSLPNCLSAEQSDQQNECRAHPSEDDQVEQGR